MDPFQFARVGPGLTFVTREALNLRLAALGMGDEDTAVSFVAALGLGSVLGVDGIERFHWEGVCLRLMEVLGRNQRVQIRQATNGAVKKENRVHVDPVAFWSETYVGGTEAALLCLMLDTAFDERGLSPSRAVETAQLIREVLDVAGRANYGIGKSSGPNGTDAGPEPSAP